MEEVRSDAWRAMFDLVRAGEGRDRVQEVCAELGVTACILRTVMFVGTRDDIRLGEERSAGMPPILGMNLLRLFRVLIDSPASRVELTRP